MADNNLVTKGLVTCKPASPAAFAEFEEAREKHGFSSIMKAGADAKLSFPEQDICDFLRTLLVLHNQSNAAVDLYVAAVCRAREQLIDRLVAIEDSDDFDPAQLWKEIQSIAAEHQICEHPRSKDELDMSEAAKQNRIQATSKLYANTLLAETDTVPVIVEPHALFYGEMIVCAVAYCKNKNLIELMKHLAKIYDCKEDEFYAVAILLGVSLRSTEVSQLSFVFGMIHQPSALRQLVFGEPTQELADAFKLLCLITLVQRMETLFQANRFQSIFGVACGNTEGLRAVRYAYERALLVPEITTYVTKAVAVLVSASPAGKTLHLTKSNSKTHGQGSFCTEKMMGDMIHIEIQSYREEMQQEMKKEMEGMIHMEMQTYREKMQQEMQKEQEKDRGFRSSLHFLVLPFFQGAYDELRLHSNATDTAVVAHGIRSMKNKLGLPNPRIVEVNGAAPTVIKSEKGGLGKRGRKRVA